MKFIGLISQYKGEEKDTYYWYFFQDNKLTTDVYVGTNPGFERMINGCKRTLIISLCENFLAEEKQIDFPGQKSQSYTENLKRIKDYIEWGLETKHPLKVIAKAIPCIKAMKTIFEEISDDKQKIILVFIAKSMHKIAADEMGLK